MGINHLVKSSESVDEMLLFGSRLAKAIRTGAIIFLHGALGVGKTTFTRGFLQGMGYEGKVKSPTYTLIESYKTKNQPVHHFDFYRLHDTRELEYIGIHEYFDDNAICLIEWPENGLTLLPDPDLALYFTIDGGNRKIRMEASNERGEDILKRFKESSEQ